MPDNGEDDSGVVYREADSSKEDHGWSNPLSWTDDGTDDQYVVNMEFKSLDAPYQEYQAPTYMLDEDIIDSMSDEKYAVKSVAKSNARWEKEEKQRQEDYDK